MAGWHEYPPKRPQKLEMVDPSLYQNTARLKKMDEYGIYAQILYPNVAASAPAGSWAWRPGADAALRAGLQRLADRVGQRDPKR
jgi:hypothetical protein